MIVSNLTPREELNLHGHLTPATAEWLVDLHEALDFYTIRETLQQALESLPPGGVHNEGLVNLQVFCHYCEQEYREELRNILDEITKAAEEVDRCSDNVTKHLTKVGEMINALEDLT